MNEESLFAAALEKQDAAQRQAFLQEACGDDVALRERLEKLLAAHGHARGVLERGPECAAPITNRQAPAIAAGRVFAGRFKLREKLGEGGMGEIWVADQIQHVHRRVALKVIRSGLDSARMLARFDQERQALAVMDHPNIAKVLDAGIAETGQPFFAMELIKGIPITKYCDEAQLSPQQRIELFIPVCQAVQHAHQKGIIHRDIKPSNILVGLYDGRPVPKVIDFGVAKSIGPRLTEHSVYTEFGALIGTLEYMSPEQAELNNLDIDTRSDIYALGAVLYELLTGSVPFSRKDLQSAAFTEMLRIIKEVEPPKPSTKLSGSGALRSVGVARQTEPKKLIEMLRGELDWIVIKCLEKNRGRRYESASALALDLQRYLSNEPVVAGPPSARYRLRKFFLRNRVLVSVAATILFLLLAGIVGTGIGFVRAEKAHLAEKERAEGERLAKLSAEKRLAQVEKGIDVLGAIFENLDPRAEEKEDRPLRMILGDRLDQTAVDLEGEAIGDSLVAARLQDRLARTYLGLGEPAKAVTLFTKALATRQAELGAENPLTLRTESGLAQANYLVGRPLEAIQMFEQVRDVQLRTVGPDDLDTLTTLDALGRVYWLTGETSRAIALLEQVRDSRVKQLGEDNEATLATLESLGGAYTAALKHSEAIAVAEKVLAARVKRHGDDNPVTLAALIGLGRAYQAGYKMRQAIALFEQARIAVVPKLGPNHPTTLAILYNLAHMYRAFGRTAEAIALGEEVLKRRVMFYGSQHPAALDTMQLLALAYWTDKKPDKALPLFEQAALGLERLKFAHSRAAYVIDTMCDCLEQVKQYEKAEGWRRKWLAAAKAKEGPESRPYLEELLALGSNLLRQDKYTAAETVLSERLALLRKNASQGAQIFDNQALLGAALLGQQKYTEAEPLLVQGYQGMKASQKERAQPHHGPPTSQRLSEVLERLVRLYDAWGKKSEADKWRTELEAIKPMPPDELQSNL
jgi:eukaryotic-like serine/threonine-protein kinase